MTASDPAVTVQWVERPDYRVAVHERVTADGQGDLLLLHGAGVASEATWYPFFPHFSEYARIVCVDLRGMGRSHAPDGLDRPLSVEIVVADVMAVMDALSITCCDLVGYSFGGLVALMLRQRMPERIRKTALIEPALLERAEIDQLRTLRAQYAKAAERLLSDQDPHLGVVDFLNLVAPNRSKHPRVERMTVQRLAARPEGLAYALMAVNEAAWVVDRQALIGTLGPTLSVLGGRSPEAAKLLHVALAEQHAHWSMLEIPGVDHALPYQKPAAVAEAIRNFFRD